MGIQLTTIFLILAALIGLFIGLLISSLFGGREAQRKKLPKELAQEGFSEAAGLFLSPAGKKIVTELDGEFYKEFGKLTKPQQDKVLELIDLWQAWTTAPVAEPAPVGDTTPIKIAEAPAEAAAVTEAVLETPDLEKSSEEVSPFTEPADENQDVISNLQQSLTDEEESAPGDELPVNLNMSITEQIDAILQNMVSNTDLKDKGIRLIENADHGVDVHVGAETFDGIESVPYPQVRQFIHDAVVRWEQETESQTRI